VLCSVYSRRIGIPGAATAVSRYIAKDRRARFPEFSATAVDDFLADPGLAQEPGCADKSISASKSAVKK
jgi:hypothetical protein